MGKKSRRNKPAKAENARRGAADDGEDWGDADPDGEQDWWVRGEANRDAVVESLKHLDVDDPDAEAPEHPLADRDREFGLRPLTQSAKREKRRRPQCDVCGEDEAKYRCMRCNSQNYCGRACQTHAWGAGHRSECATLRETCSSAVQAQTPSPRQQQ